MLSAELENGRLVRLVSKLGFINERPEYMHLIQIRDGRHMGRNGRPISSQAV
jgi:Pan3 Pseudokinase domain